MANETLYDPELWRKLEERVIPEPNSGCLLWTLAVSTNGYGVTALPRCHSIRSKRNINTHRAAWIANYGPIPEGMHVCHKCDVKLCINPTHMFLGTNAVNRADSVAKNRHARGITNGATKLNEDTVKAIRAAIGFQRDIAKRFGVSPTTVNRVKLGRLWQHLL